MMFNIIGRLIGMKKEDIKYDRGVIIFMLVGTIIFLFLGVSHTQRGARFIYANKFNKVLLTNVEEEGINKADIDKILFDFKNKVAPFNIQEYEYEDIKDNLESYTKKLKSWNNPKLYNIIYKLENINYINDKETIIKQLNEIKLEDMLISISKANIVEKNLEEIAQCQTNVFLSNVYFIFATITGISFIIVKVIYDISLFGEKKDKKQNINYIK